MRKKWSAVASSFVLAGLLALTSCGSGNSKAATSEEAQASPTPAATAAGDVTTTNLADSNYSTQEQLETRKRGLAAESAEDADASKTGTIDPIALDPYTR